jgi:hypothetical protein
MLDKIQINIGNWRWVVGLAVCCATSIALSNMWIPYLQDRDHVELVLRSTELMDKNMPPAARKAMGGMEYPIRKKKTTAVGD